MRKQDEQEKDEGRKQEGGMAARGRQIDETRRPCLRDGSGQVVGIDGVQEQHLQWERCEDAMREASPV
jgi:hypothetical protein